MLATNRSLISFAVALLIFALTLPGNAQAALTGQTSNFNNSVASIEKRSLTPAVYPPERYPALIENRGQLTGSDRVYYQRAVDEVYWRHMIWPARNGVKPAFAATPAGRAIHVKVDDVMRKSNALLQIWGQPITGKMLQAEIDRMARNTRRPEVLRELFATLQNNPYLVAEVIARPALVDRLVRRFFASDNRFKTAISFDSWWTQAREGFDTKLVTRSYIYHLPTLVQAGPEVGEWRPMAALRTVKWKIMPSRSPLLPTLTS